MPVDVRRWVVKSQVEGGSRLLVAEARSPAELDAMVSRRSAGQPLEHVIGWVKFCGRRIYVDPGVFVPRRRTELLVTGAVDLARSAAAGSSRGAEQPRPVVVDLCCGSGAVGVAVAADLEPVELHACDIDPVAVRCARRNLATVGGYVHTGDLYQPLPDRLRGRVDVLVVNAPYVPTDALRLMPPEARMHEPRVALEGGHDGLDVHRRIADEAAQWLAPGGHLLIETSRRQGPCTADCVAAGGLSPRVATSQELDATVVVGHLPAGRAEAFAHAR